MLYNKAICLPTTAQFSRPRNSSTTLLASVGREQESFRALRIKKASTLAGSMVVSKHHMCFYFPPILQGSFKEASAFRTQRQTQLLECSDSSRGHCTHLAPTLCQIFSLTLTESSQESRNAGWIIPPCMWEPRPECTQPANGRMASDDAKRREVWL